MVEIKLYTVKQLRDWLEHNQAAEGLSERVIAPTRAWAFIHNPYVKDEDAIVAAIFEDGQLAAYTASFPDMLDGQRIWWASTLYCYPQFAGRGYGMIVVGSLMEAHEPDLTYDRWGASETVEIFKHFGYQTVYNPRFHLSFKKIDATSLKGKLAYVAQELKKCLHPWPKASKADYTIQYVSTIDDEAYAFMNAHKGTNLWLREQEMLNWIVAYPFIKVGKNEKACEFGYDAKLYEYKVVKVYAGMNIVGVYVLRQHDDSLSVVYLYCNEECSDVIFTSIVDYIVVVKPNEFVAENHELLGFVQTRVYYPRLQEVAVSLSLPDNVQLPQNRSFQFGDGDSFA